MVVVKMRRHAAKVCTAIDPSDAGGAAGIDLKSMIRLFTCVPRPCVKYTRVQRVGKQYWVPTVSNHGLVINDKSRNKNSTELAVQLLASCFSDI